LTFTTVLEIIQNISKVIGSCAFGIECNSLEDPNAEFRRLSRKAFDEPKYSRIFFSLVLMFKDIARKLHVSLINPETTDFFLNAVKQTVEYREKNNISRNDFMHLLIQLKNNGVIEGESTKNGNLTVEEVAAQGKTKRFLRYLGNF
jgi:cytochrome P450 family 6